MTRIKKGLPELPKSPEFHPSKVGLPPQHAKNRACWGPRACRGPRNCQNLKSRANSQEQKANEAGSRQKQAPAPQAMIASNSAGLLLVASVEQMIDGAEYVLSAGGVLHERIGQ